jgi:hypothetical protein
MALTEDEIARLARLQAAREAQISGKGVSRISAHGRAKDMAPADLGRLEGDIETLQSKAATGRARKRGSVTFRWR